MRSLLLGLVLLAGGDAAAANPAKAIDARLAAIVAGEATGNPLAGAALAVMKGETLIYAGAAGCAQLETGPPQRCKRALKPETKMRVASISKMAAALAALALVEEGKLDLDLDISDYLGWPLRNPAFAADPITARQLMTHVSSLRDPEEYWVAAPGQFRTLVERETPFAANDDGAARAPGRFFTYANINYGVLASVMERAAGERFDELVARRVLDPLGLDAGFNWSGVSEKARRKAATLYRIEDGRWTAQVDGPEMLSGSGPVFLKAPEINAGAYLAGYSPGANATLFSPQGGLRASVLDLLTILRARGPVEAGWRFDPDTENGDTEGGYYFAAGPGALIVEGGEIFPGARLVGHPGEAYGLYAGVWRVEQEGESADAALSIAYAITGLSQSPAKGAHPTFNTAEEALLRLALEAAAAPATAIHDDDNPRPFDETRDAMADINMALFAAKASGKRVLLVLGGNWCHDSRSLAAKFATPDLASLIADRYELVWVDVGQRNRNLDIASRFGVGALQGTPTILIVSPDGVLLNEASVHDWRNADSRSLAETTAYFEAFAE